jgi:hypothetical protein
MLFLSVVVVLEGAISTEGPIDARRKQLLLYAAGRIKGVRLSSVACEVVGGRQKVTFTYSIATSQGLARIDPVLRGLGSMKEFFGSPASLLLQRAV